MDWTERQSGLVVPSEGFCCILPGSGSKVRTMTTERRVPSPSDSDAHIDTCGYWTMVMKAKVGKWECHGCLAKEDVEQQQQG